MPKLQIFDAKDKIPEALAEYYTEKDGKFYPDFEGLKTQEDVDRAMAAMEKQKELRIEKEKELAKFKDVDLETWEKVKDLDPNTHGDADPDTEKEIQKRVAAGVREKEQEVRDSNKKVLDEKIAELETKEKAIKQSHKENWIKQHLTEKFGFTDPKRLRWLMLDIEAGQHPELKKKIDSIEVSDESGIPVIVGGSLGDKEGAIEVLENIAGSEVIKDYKPASDNSGGGAGNSGSGSGTKTNPYKKESFNVTEQGKLERESPEEAKRLAAQAGVALA